MPDFLLLAPVLPLSLPHPAGGRWGDSCYCQLRTGSKREAFTLGLFKLRIIIFWSRSGMSFSPSHLRIEMGEFPPLLFLIEGREC